MVVPQLELVMFDGGLAACHHHWRPFVRWSEMEGSRCRVTSVWALEFNEDRRLSRRCGCRDSLSMVWILDGAGLNDLPSGLQALDIYASEMIRRPGSRLFPMLPKVEGKLLSS